MSFNAFSILVVTLFSVLVSKEFPIGLSYLYGADDLIVDSS